MPVPSNQSGPMFANKKEYTPAEIRDNFIAINEELKKNGYTYYQLPSMQITQIMQDGKQVAYYPDIANISYPTVVGPKGSITDYKSANFDEALMRKFTDAKLLSDQYQGRVSREIRSAMASAVDPSKVDVSAIISSVNSSVDRQNGGGRGITLSPNDPQLKASSMMINRELRGGGGSRIGIDSLSIEAVRNNDADSIVALRKTWGAQPASPDNGLDPNSDEYQYLSRKKGIESSERMSAGAYKSTVAENEAALKTAWANFKSANDELKAKGYSYYEAKDGMYGTAVSLRGSYNDYLKKVEGPKGDINSIYGATAEGVIVNPIGNPASPQFDKSLSDLKNKFNQNGPHIIASASGGLAQAQSFEDIEARLVAKGVDLVKLEQDNPYSAGFGNNQQVTFGAKPSTGTNLPQTAGTQSPYDIVGLSAEAAKGIIGLPEKKLGGHNGSNPLQATVSNPSVPVPGTNIGQYIDHIQAQTNAMNAGTWKPSDGYYFSSPNGVGFDPTGTLKAIVDSHPLMNGNNAPNPDNQQALKDAGYSYMTGPQNDTMVVGPKGPYNVGWTTDPAKKGDYQKDLEKLWASTGVTFSGQTSMPATATTNYVQPSVTANESLVASRTDNLSQNPVSKSIDKSGNLVAQASIAGSSLPGTTNAVPYVAPAVNPVAEKLSGSKRSASGGGTNGTPINGGFGPDPTGGLGVWPPTNTPKFTQ